MNRLRAAEFCWERGGAQVGKRADGSSGGMGWAVMARMHHSASSDSSGATPSAVGDRSSSDEKGVNV